MKRYRVVLFDLDGTISDPKEGIIQSLTYALQKMGISTLEKQKLDLFIGPPLQDSLKQYVQLTDKQIQVALGYYRERYKAIGMYENTLYEGIVPMLGDLKASGLTLAVATSKPTLFAEAILDYFQMDQLFELIVGSNMDGTRRHKKEMISDVLTKLDMTDLNEVIMIGDRSHDIIGAKACGIDSIGVTYGYGSAAELTSAGATYVVNKVTDIKRVLVEGNQNGFLSDIKKIQR